MENDWRMHPLLSLQIYLTERAGKQGGVDGWMDVGGDSAFSRGTGRGGGAGERLGVAAVSFISS